MPGPKFSSDRVMMLNAYLRSLRTGQGGQAGLSLSDLLANRIDKVRLWTDSNDQRTMITEVFLPKHGGLMQSHPYAEDTELVHLLEQISDPELAMDLTVDMESGAVSLAVEKEPALVGQDLSQFGGATEFSDPPMFDDEPSDEFLSAEEAARELDTAKSTITRRISANELIGYKLFKKSFLIPRDQIIRKTIVKGIPEVLEMFGFDHYEAWRFLSAALFYGEPTPRPIDKLRSVKTDADLQTLLPELRAAKDSFEFGDHM